MYVHYAFASVTGSSAAHDNADVASKLDLSTFKQHFIVAVQSRKARAQRTRELLLYINTSKYAYIYVSVVTTRLTYSCCRVASCVSTAGGSRRAMAATVTLTFNKSI
eukprot:TRINITY_DN29948_c0_g1_i1.p2 TRINITY_DN29948_c0_g1~~TRINITY_DN29948_c0_g1_i1.p2  ORF type:complete len:107 (-),score=15.82 TRINITY_DN29948_c0_g1_i1:26-346(-)